MAIYNLGSINIDVVYRLANLPRPGETLVARSVTRGLGGKGANQSIAIARSGGQVSHIGAIGGEDEWVCDILVDAGIDVRAIARLETTTGHAIINVDDAGENSIVLCAGANAEISESQIEAGLAGARTGDWFLLQNETNLGTHAATLAQKKGMRVCYSAAPFSTDAVREILPLTDLLVVNEIEFKQIEDDLSDLRARMDEIAVVVTLGADGAVLREGGRHDKIGAFAAQAVDTTGAGDTFLGCALAGIDGGAPMEQALRRAAAAAAIQVSREGAAAAIPTTSEIDEFLQGLT